MDLIDVISNDMQLANDKRKMHQEKDQRITSDIFQEAVLANPSGNSKEHGRAENTKGKTKW